MTEPQDRTLESLRAVYPAWRSPYSLGASRTVLDALVRRGLAERQQQAGAFFDPRIDIQYRAIPEATHRDQEDDH